MDEVLVGVLSMGFGVLGAGWRSLARAVRVGPPRRDPLTVAAASVSGSLFVPLLVAACLFFVEVVRVMDDDFFWFIGLIVGLPVGLFLLAAGFGMLLLGLTLGVGLLTDRPAARMKAGGLSLGGWLVGAILLWISDPVAEVTGQATLILAGLLLVLLVVPRAEPSLAVDDRTVPPPDRFSKARPRRFSRQRFTL